MKGILLKLRIAAVGVIGTTAIILFGGTSAEAANFYVRSTVGSPWGVDTNEQAMNLAFGAGGWNQAFFETTNAASLFSAANQFVYLEGGDSNADELETFLTANLSTIQSWVSAGGSLFVNAAPNEGNGMSYGFGGVTLNYPDFGSSVSAVDASHPIFNGPFGTTTSFTGNAFAHATVTGGGITSLIKNEFGGSVLAELLYGNGIALFGGMTTTNFQQPNPQALNLRANIIAYGANYGATAIPTPALLPGLIGMGIAAMRKRKSEAVEANSEA